MEIVYALEPELSAQAFAAVLNASTLGERRPVDDPARLDQMLRNADIVLTARHEGRLIGVSRAVTDFSYACYLSDLAVDQAYQRQGIGRELVERTHAAAGETAALILIAAPAAESYYPKIGMTPIRSAWMVPRTR